MKFEKMERALQRELEREFVEALEDSEKHLTAKELEKVTAGKKTISDYVVKINTRVAKKSYNQKLIERLHTVEKATKKISSISITVEWAKSRTWGMNPKAEARFFFTDNTAAVYTSSSISGCGYDKESTATGQALNQCNELLNMLYQVQEKHFDEKAQNRDAQREYLGYGSGYGANPYFEGGVGFSCHRKILEKLGFKLSSENHGKTFDVYSFTLE